MFKKNKLSIFLFAVVAMLTVYYIKNPMEENGTVIETSRYYQTERDTINSVRTSLIVELEEIISSSEVNIEEKEIAINKMSEINTLTEKEMSLEYQIMDLGYKDCLVQASIDDKSLSINVIDEEVTKEEFIQISILASSKFENYKLTLNYETI